MTTDKYGMEHQKFRYEIICKHKDEEAQKRFECFLWESLDAYDVENDGTLLEEAGSEEVK